MEESMKKENLEVIVKLALRDSETDAHASAFGRGVARLCELVDELGSLNKAAKELDMAYSKAWRIMKDTEDALGVELIERQGSKGSTLTDEGKILTQIYRKVEKETKAYAARTLADYLKKEFPGK
jgi:molybdate transport system regulatory protein